MAEEVIVPPATPTQSPFGAAAWSEEIPAPPQQSVQEPPKQPEGSSAQPASTPTATPAPSNEEVIDPKEWLKREFEVDDPQLIKQQLAELKTLREKAQTPAEIKYANEQSKQFHEALLAGKEDDVYNLLHEKRRLSKLTGSEVNRLSAEDIIKYDIQSKNKTLTSDEVDFLFKQNYSFPPKPVKDLTDTDEDYNQRVEEWNQQVANIEKKLVIESKMLIPQLQKLQSELILPEIQKQVDPKEAEAQQKELARINGLREQYLKHLEDDYKKFDGYKVTYKDEDVEIPVSFGVTPEEQAALKTELQTFDIDGFISGRWFNQDGSPNVSQIMSDVTLLRKGESVFQKIANEVGTKMREHYIKVRSNINVNGNGGQQVFQPNVSNGQQGSPFSAGAWSETPPVFTN